MTTTPRTARERARAEITQEILDTARTHLARDGAAALSLRAVARDCGMASSAVYRYFPSRDALLTQLIIDAYNSLGAHAEDVAHRVARRGPGARFMAICHAVREWALEHPHEYALLYGSPVPGYAAPQDTIEPASRVPNILLGGLHEFHATTPSDERPLPRAVVAALRPLLESGGVAIPPDLLVRGLASWAALFGAVSFEVFGHLNNVVADDPRARRAYFDQVFGDIADGLGLTGR